MQYSLQNATCLECGRKSPVMLYPAILSQLTFISDTVDVASFEINRCQICAAFDDRPISRDYYWFLTDGRVYTMNSNVGRIDNVTPVWKPELILNRYKLSFSDVEMRILMFAIGLLTDDDIEQIKMTQPVCNEHTVNNTFRKIHEAQANDDMYNPVWKNDVNTAALIISAANEEDNVSYQNWMRIGQLVFSPAEAVNQNQVVQDWLLNNIIRMEELFNTPAQTA
jgi:hypothetical protein